MESQKGGAPKPGGSSESGGEGGGRLCVSEATGKWTGWAQGLRCMEVKGDLAKSRPGRVGDEDYCGVGSSEDAKKIF